MENNILHWWETYVKEQIRLFYLCEGKRKRQEARLQEIIFMFLFYVLLDYHREGHTTDIHFRYLQKRIQNINSIPQKLYTGGD